MDGRTPYKLGQPVSFHFKGVLCYPEQYNGAVEYGVRSQDGEELRLVAPLGQLAQGERLVSWAEFVDKDYVWDQKFVVQTGEKDFGQVVEPIFETRQVPTGRYAVFVYEPTEGPALALSKVGERVSLGTNMDSARPRLRIIQEIEILP